MSLTERARREPRGARCASCGGSGWRSVEGPDGSYAVRCECFAAGERARKLRRAGIPAGLEHCDLESFMAQVETHEAGKGGGSLRVHPQLELARSVAREFVATYPLTGPTGLLFHGPAGGGKTHLAVAIVAAVTLEKGARALFLDFRELLKTIQESYNAVSETSEKEVLRRVLDADLLVLDDLGAEKPSPWVRETVAYVINARYTAGKPILITTNLRYQDRSDERDEPRRDMARRVGRDGETRVDSLEDRVGTATLSRLCEMCKPIAMTEAPDYRRTRLVFGTGKKGFHLG